jgi:hypothetical protein
MSVPAVSTSPQKAHDLPPLTRSKRYLDIREAFKNFSPAEQESLYKTMEVFSQKRKSQT